MGHGVAAALIVHDRHPLAASGIAPDRGLDLAGGDVKSAPDEGQIFPRKRPCAAVVGEKLG